MTLNIWKSSCSDRQGVYATMYLAQLITLAGFTISEEEDCLVFKGERDETIHLSDNGGEINIRCIGTNYDVTISVPTEATPSPTIETTAFRILKVVKGHPIDWEANVGGMKIYRVDGDPAVYARTFLAGKYPKGSWEREWLNHLAVSSEYKPEHQYIVIRPAIMDDGSFVSLTGDVHMFPTQIEAENKAGKLASRYAYMFREREVSALVKQLSKSHSQSLKAIQKALFQFNERFHALVTILDYFAWANTSGVKASEMLIMYELDNTPIPDFTSLLSNWQKPS